MFDGETRPMIDGSGLATHERRALRRPGKKRHVSSNNASSAGHHFISVFTGSRCVNRGSRMALVKDAEFSSLRYPKPIRSATEARYCPRSWDNSSWLSAVVGLP